MSVYEVNLVDRIARNEADISRLNSEVQGLKRWQDRQNGTLDRIDSKMESKFEHIDSKIDNQFRWLIGTAITSALSLVGVLIAAISLFLRVS